MAKKFEGMLRGPSHDNGGIKFSIGNEIQEAEGGEYVIRKSSVNNKTERILKYINEKDSHNATLLFSLLGILAINKVSR